jgi:cytochrome c oxidase cbb3-type subunit 3
MSSGWSYWIALVSLANILACLWLLWWTSRKRPGEPSDADTTGHTWDGDLTEYNKPLPRWWLNLFYATVAFSLVYLVLFPGLGAFAGTQQWSSEKQLREEVAAADATLKPLFAKFAGSDLSALAKDPQALALGHSVFANNCTTCHGSDARGAKGFPNLTDSDWIWGGAPDTVLTTIMDGRQAVMPPMGQVLGEDGVTQVAVYVQSLSGAPVDAALAHAGEARFQAICSACHGPDGKGNPLLGAPNLTDKVWLYGGDFATISETIRNGRNGKMPAHRDILGEDRARLVAAWVLSQGAK